MESSRVHVQPHYRIVNRRRARRLRWLNSVLIPISCVFPLWLAWEVWRAFR